MKRGAERQLTKDEFEDGDVEPESTSDTGFKKAPDEILKGRVIRGLPNRTLKPFGVQSNSTNGTTVFSSSNQPAAADEDDPVLFQYYINLRGLNHSLLHSISKGIENDPFADMSGILESYNSTFLKIQKEKDDVSDDAGDGGEGSEQATLATEDGESSGSTSNLLAAHNPHDDEGEGEENEISVHAIKVKAYRMKKADAKGSPGWADLGFGILRLKKDKDTNARRILLRNSTNGKILINFKIYSGLKPSLVKKALTFVGHDNGVSQTYCVRLAGEEQAQQLKEALDQEIELVAVKE